MYDSTLKVKEYIFLAEKALRQLLNYRKGNKRTWQLS